MMTGRMYAAPGYQSGMNNWRKGRPAKRKGRKRKTTKVSKKIRKYVKKAIRVADNDDKINVYRNIDSGQYAVSANQVSYSSAFIGTTATLDAVIDGTQTVYNNAGVLNVTGLDLSDQTNVGNYRVHVHNDIMRLELRNNGNTPCRIQAFWYCPRKTLNVADAPLTQYARELAAKGFTGTATQDPMYNLWDAGKGFKDNWKLDKTRRYNLNAGDNLSLYLTQRRPYDYNPLNDTNFYFDKKRSKVLILRFQGVVSHDETNTANVGTCDCTIDYVHYFHTRYSAEVGGKFKWIHEGDGALDAQTDPLVDIKEIEATGMEL